MVINPRVRVEKLFIELIIENKGIMNNFEMIKIKDLEIIMGLSKKKSTKEDITSDTRILKVMFYVIKEKFVDIINNSLMEGCYLDNWKTSMIILTPKIEKTIKASEYRSINNKLGILTDRAKTQVLMHNNLLLLNFY